MINTSVQLHNNDRNITGPEVSVPVHIKIVMYDSAVFFSYAFRRWNLWFPWAGVFVEVFARRATKTPITIFPVI